MWIVFDSETGAELRREAQQPAPVAGEAFTRIPGSALADTPLSVWSPAVRGFVDVPVLDPQGIWNLFTGDEKMAICLSPVPEVRALVMALPFTPATRPTDPWHSAGVQLLAGVGLLTPARAARVLAFLPPEAPQ